MNSAASRVLGVLRSREMGILLAFVLVVVVSTLKNPNFVFSKDGWHDLLITPSILVVVAVGEAIVIITRNVDLSVGSMLGLSAYLAGTIFVKFPSIPWQLVFLIVLAFGALLEGTYGALFLRELYFSSAIGGAVLASIVSYTHVLEIGRAHV